MNNSLFKSIALNIILVLSTASFNKTNCFSNDTLNNALLFTGMVTGGYFIYKIVSKGLEKSEKQLISDAYSAVQSAVRHSEIDILDNEFDILNLSESEKRYKIGLIKENLLYRLIPAVNKNTFAKDYLYSLNSTISKLKRNQADLDYYINNRNYNSVDTKNLYKTINKLLPKLKFLSSYVSAHIGYFNLCKTTDKISNEYSKELDLVNSSNISYKEFKWVVRNAGCKIDPKYPFISFIKKLNLTINELENAISNLSYKYPNLLSFSTNMQHKLSSIHDNSISAEEYSIESKEQEIDNRQKAELRLKEKELALKQRIEEEKIAIKERELAAREREIQFNENKYFNKNKR